MNTHSGMLQTRWLLVLALMSVTGCQSSTSESQAGTGSPPQSERGSVAFLPGKLPAGAVEGFCPDGLAPLTTCNWAGGADLILTAEILDQELRAKPWNTGLGSSISLNACTGVHRAAFALRVRVLDVVLGSLGPSESADDLAVLLGAEGLNAWAPYPTASDVSGVTWSDGSSSGAGTSPLSPGTTVGLHLVRDSAGRLSLAQQLPYTFSVDGSVTFPETGECSSLNPPDALQNAAYADFVSAVSVCSPASGTHYGTRRDMADGQPLESFAALCQLENHSTAVECRDDSWCDGEKTCQDGRCVAPNN